jgi:hypothetical protein
MRRNTLLPGEFPAVAELLGEPLLLNVPPHQPAQGTRGKRRTVNSTLDGRLGGQETIGAVQNWRAKPMTSQSRRTIEAPRG